MRIMSVSGAAHRVLVNAGLEHIDFVKPEGLYLTEVIEHLESNKIGCDGVVITDESLPTDDYTLKMILEDVLEKIDRMDGSVNIHMFTRNLHLHKELDDMQNKYSKFNVYYSELTRIPLSFYQKNQCKKESDAVHKTPFFERFKMKKTQQNQKTEARDELSKALDQISCGISRVVAVTGHRGSGISSTAVNVAYEASQRGLRTIVIDLDIDFRGFNLYLNQFSESVDDDNELASSLLKMLAKPHEYKENAVNVNEKLWVSSLSYSFKDDLLIDKFYTSQRLIGLVSVLKQHFNFVVLDMPLEQLSKFKDLIIHIDTFGICIPNNLYGVLNLLRGMELYFSKADLAYLNSKSNIIVTKYSLDSSFQESPLTGERVCELLTSDISDIFYSNFPLCGEVPYDSKFDQQIETGKLAVQNSAVFKKAYSGILLRLMSGGK